MRKRELQSLCDKTATENKELQETNAELEERCRCHRETERMLREELENAEQRTKDILKAIPESLMREITLQ